MFLVLCSTFLWHFQAKNTTLKTYGSYLYSFFLHYINIFKQLKMRQKCRTQHLNHTVVIFIHFSYIISTFGVKRCKILCLIKDFYWSLESGQVQASQNKVNVWDPGLSLRAGGREFPSATINMAPGYSHKKAEEK